jgi:GNAT superfamily N-acetyltransferase
VSQACYDSHVHITETEDFAAIQRLAYQIWREYYPIILSADQIDYMLRSMYSLETLAADRARGARFALIGDVGFLGYEPVKDTVKLHKLYVLASARGQGVGAQALAYVEARAKSLGAKRIELNVNKQNTLAQKSYERAGFSKTKSVVIAIGGGFVMDDYIYEKVI